MWDGEGAIGRWRAGKAELTGDCQAFRGTLGTRVIICKPADPEAKGLVERFHDYLERSFLPGRDFAGPADFNAQLGRWLAVANTRIRRALGCSAAERIAADKQAMLTLPPVAPVTGWRSFTRLARDHYIRLDSNDYSVHPAVIGRRIEVTADLDRVRVACEGRVVADHERIWAWHQTMSDPEHVEAARRCAGSGSRSSARRGRPRCRSGAWPTTTPRWELAAPAGRWRDDRRPDREP